LFVPKCNLLSGRTLEYDDGMVMDSDQLLLKSEHAALLVFRDKDSTIKSKRYHRIYEKTHTYINVLFDSVIYQRKGFLFIILYIIYIRT